MKQVDFLETTDDGQRITFSVCLVPSGLLTVIGKGRESAKRLGIPDEPQIGEGGQVIEPSDPEKYLEALRFAYSGSRLRATEVFEK